MEKTDTNRRIIKKASWNIKDKVILRFIDASISLSRQDIIK